MSGGRVVLSREVWIGPDSGRGPTSGRWAVLNF